ncbi:MAG: phosphate signaling complex protein PhoU [Candidimonas sp.]|nr:MAG: phosphate signaling complex protein PhoU [Candidimonas sp.]TAM25014.1 MAG: phosphate signaling complex protein PhoU [Candidimonas sp.]TAM73827.1 MAG: phosphate signaling complex protein PhoU [Candidimonas sp.]
MSEHTNKQFHSDLESTRSLFLQMGGLVEAMVQEGMEALTSGDLSLVDRVREREKDVNRLEVEIDELISLLIARNQPTAIDLRLLLSVSKMLTDMERCGDEAEKIAKMARRLHESETPYVPVIELRHMASHVATMIRDALDSFAREDPVHAAMVVRNDKDVDKEWKASLRHVITYMIEDPRTISRSIDLIFIARSLERIGDHAKNMAERVIYMVRGDDVRHTGVKNTERTARGQVPDEENEI